MSNINIEHYKKQITTHAGIFKDMLVTGSHLNNCSKYGTQAMQEILYLNHCTVVTRVSRYGDFTFRIFVSLLTKEICLIHYYITNDPTMVNKIKEQ